MTLLRGVGKLPGVLAGVALIAFPALLLPEPSAANATYTILLLWSLGCAATALRPGACRWPQWWRGGWPLMLGMAGLPLAVVFHQALMGMAIDVPYLYLRFALFGLLVWGLLNLGRSVLEVAQWGFAAGAISSAIWIHFATLGGRPAHVGIFNVIPFSNLALLMGIVTVVSIGWSPGHRRVEIAVKFLAGLAGLYASYASGTRGGWIAIPVLLLVALLGFRRWSLRRRMAVFAALLVMGTVVGMASDTVRERVAQSIRHLSDYGPDDLDTSEGGRLQVWAASLRMIEAYPLTGVGVKGFEPALEEQWRQGLVTTFAATLPHSHNDILYATATLGIPGLLAILALYLAPAWFFVRHLRSPDHPTAVAAVMGLAITTGFFMFGLTETMFVIAMTNAFYVLSLAVVVAFIVARRDELAAGGGAGA
ncbi:MAG: O-antigen ligase family protein [Pigmentiphaga sp.]|uniref:O-antigen ligase family protein n=1 Tax=Pigmentiphaga sp. TaxID=1977564 RepID=UPI0029B1C2B6|nr:O-antigen ligase family protein [Pigmentiphaga sp.]MDX3904357.1 O-antigen ligase family protein [Pigmentiphaga sp.]